MIKRHWWIVILRCLGVAILSVAITVLAGYYLDRSSLYEWPGSNAMAIPTAIAFAATGGALLLASLLFNGHRK